jgi:hypothetical protein
LSPRALGLVACLLLPLLATACPKPPAAVAAPTSPPDDGKAAQAGASRGGPLLLRTPGGEPTLELRVSDDGYDLVDRAGWPIGHARLSEDRVEMMDRDGGLLCRVTAGPAGYTLADAEGRTRVSVRETARGASLDGDVVGHWEDAALITGDARFTVARAASRTQVARDGREVLAIDGDIDEGAAYLALGELTFPERVALALFHSQLR